MSVVVWMNSRLQCEIEMHYDPRVDKPTSFMFDFAGELSEGNFCESSLVDRKETCIRL